MYHYNRDSKAEDKAKYSELMKDIKVIPFNMEKINAFFDKRLKENPNSKETDSFEVMGNFAKIVGTRLVTDMECVNEIIENDLYTFEIYKSGINENGNRYHEMIPCYTLKTNLTDLLTEYALPETTIEEFMGSRFGYNSRIFTNMSILVRKSLKEFAV